MSDKGKKGTAKPEAEAKERVTVAEYGPDEVSELTADKLFRDIIQGMFSADEDTVDAKIVIENSDGTSAEVDFEIRIKAIDGKENVE